jgi:hypothetical protein
MGMPARLFGNNAIQKEKSQNEAPTVRADQNEAV